jgi:AcrR family transcriptional regulator
MSPEKENSPTRERIITVSSEYFFNNGHRGITMDELAKLVGVSKKTLYVYFPTKLAILEAVMDVKFKRVFAILDGVRESHSGNSIEAFVAVIARWQELLAEVQPVFWRDIQADAYSFFEITSTQRRRIVHGVFGRIIEDGIRSGDFDSDVNPTLVAEIILASIEGLVRSGKAKELGLTPRELLQIMIKLIIIGSLTDEGRAKWRASSSVSI